MNTSSTQIQLKISLSPQLNDHLESKANRLGIPVTQYVKYLIIRETEKEEFPTYQASERVEKNYKEALKNYDQAVVVDDIHQFFSDLK